MCFVYIRLRNVSVLFPFPRYVYFFFPASILFIAVSPERLYKTRTPRFIFIVFIMIFERIHNGCYISLYTFPCPLSAHDTFLAWFVFLSSLLISPFSILGLYLLSGRGGQIYLSRNVGEVGVNSIRFSRQNDFKTE